MEQNYYFCQDFGLYPSLLFQEHFQVYTQWAFLPLELYQQDLPAELLTIIGKRIFYLYFRDVDIDKFVERTKYRPVTTGEIPRGRALAFFGGLTGTCFGIAYLLPPMVTGLGLLCVPLVVSYPRFKRFFPYPQVMLGVTFNMGVFMGYAAIQNALNLKILLPLYIGSILWTVVYDTIYAFQDINYDKEVGIRSCAIEFEKYPKQILGSLSAVSTVWFALWGYYAGLHPIYYAFVAATASHYSWQISTLDIKDGERCKRMFISNQYIGLLLVFGFMFGRRLQKSNKEENN